MLLMSVFDKTTVYADLESGFPAASQRRSDFIRFDWYVVLFDMA
jgi:hypothetical protein